MTFGERFLEYVAEPTIEIIALIAFIYYMGGIWKKFIVDGGEGKSRSEGWLHALFGTFGIVIILGGGLIFVSILKETVRPLFTVPTAGTTTGP